MSLYLKYRPQTLDQVRGNNLTRTALEKMLTPEKIQDCPHTFLFHGPTGCGKTTMARIVAKELGCIGMDLVELDSAHFRGIDTVREIRKNSQFAPMEGRCRAWIIDECHKMTNDAQNALLKILEDTPSHVYFILCTTDPQKLLPTIRGRCSEYQVEPLDSAVMKRLLVRVAKEEGEIITDEVCEQIIQDSFGLPRNALQILEQVLAVSEEERLEMAKKAAEQQSQVIELCRALMRKGTTWDVIRKILEGLKGQDAEEIRRIVLGYCQAVLLKTDNVLAARIMEEFWEPTYNIGFPGVVYACYSVIKS